MSKLFKGAAEIFLTKQNKLLPHSASMAAIST